MYPVSSLGSMHAGFHSGFHCSLYMYRKAASNTKLDESLGQTLPCDLTSTMKPSMWYNYSDDDATGSLRSFARPSAFQWQSS